MAEDVIYCNNNCPRFRYFAERGPYCLNGPRPVTLGSKCCFTHNSNFQKPTNSKLEQSVTTSIFSISLAKVVAALKGRKYSSQQSKTA